MGPLGRFASPVFGAFAVAVCLVLAAYVYRGGPGRPGGPAFLGPADVGPFPPGRECEVRFKQPVAGDTVGYSGTIVTSDARWLVLRGAAGDYYIAQDTIATVQVKNLQPETRPARS